MANELIAVLLVTRSRPGPKLAFHYPLQPLIQKPHIADDAKRDSDDSDVEPENDDNESVGGKVDGHRSQTYVEDRSNVELANREDVVYEQCAIRDHLFGHSIDSLERLLSPGRWSDRKKFEVCLDGVTFVGHPVYSDEDGLWNLNSIKRSASASSDGDGIYGNGNGTVIHSEHTTAGRTANITIRSTETNVNATHDFTHISESLDSQAGPSLATSTYSTSTTIELPRENITMFHVIFALSPGQRQTAETIHDHLAVVLAKALHYCQQHTNYVAVESRKLLGLKARAQQEGWTQQTSRAQMLESSELAFALMEVYNRISAGEIAGIRLNGMQMSLQIPQEMSDSIEPHSALLLLEEKDVILRELVHAGASPLAYFVREHTPTKSLQKHARNLDVPTEEVLCLARHLIKWRKARVVAPLHSRNLYVVNAQADLSKLSDCLPEYSRRFAALPPLPQMMKMLGGTPIKYGLLIPSKDHRQPYMEILAYLLRYQFVIQMKTFGWLKASFDGNATQATPQKAARLTESTTSLLSPQLKPKGDDAVSISSKRTAVPLSTRTQSEFNELSRSIIVDSAHPSAEGKDAIDVIRRSVRGLPLEEHIQQLIPYFNGEHAFEEIAALEGFKRADVDVWLDTLDKLGHLAILRSP